MSEIQIEKQDKNEKGHYSKNIKINRRILVFQGYIHVHVHETVCIFCINGCFWIKLKNDTITKI